MIGKSYELWNALQLTNPSRIDAVSFLRIGEHQNGALSEMLTRNSRVLLGGQTPAHLWWPKWCRATIKFIPECHAKLVIAYYPGNGYKVFSTSCNLEGSQWINQMYELKRTDAKIAKIWFEATWKNAKCLKKPIETPKYELEKLRNG
jgi:hypothetical protein